MRSESWAFVTGPQVTAVAGAPGLQHGLDTGVQLGGRGGLYLTVSKVMLQGLCFCQPKGAL